METIAPILSSFDKEGITYRFADIIQFPWVILFYRPKVLLITSFSGARINDRVCRIAHRLNIKVVSLMAEGNIRESEVSEFFWGNNKKKEIYFHSVLVWSERAKNLIVNEFPNLKEKLIVCGAIKYDASPNETISSAKRKIKDFNLEHFDYVVSIAGWTFGNFFEDSLFWSNYKEHLIKVHGCEGIDGFRKDFIKVKKFYEDIVEAHPEILFLIKKHPGLQEEKYSEFSKLKNSINVIDVDKNPNIFLTDMYLLSDIWIVYDSTTVIEAWLYGKNSFRVNPTGSWSPRDQIYKGSAELRKPEQFSKIFENGLNRRQDNKQLKKMLIIETIGFDDRKSHIRVLNYLNELLEETPYPSLRTSYIIKNVGIWSIIISLLKSQPVINKIAGGRIIDNEKMRKLRLKWIKGA